MTVHEVLRKFGDRYLCCQFAGVPIRSLSGREREFFRVFMPDAASALVVCHHVVTMKEWTWSQTPDGGERCDADDHTAEVCLEIRDVLDKGGFETEIVPYPIESGLQFRYVAQSAGVGRIGKSAFLLHPEWGPWVHLRVLATAAPAEESPPVARSPRDICGDCTKCIDRCPASAFENGFNGLRCREYRKEKGEYSPVGPERIYEYCKICALVCPLGQKPEKENQ